MPTIIAIDCSLSMSKNLTSVEDGSPMSKLQLAQLISTQVLEHLLKASLEHTAILSFSSDVKLICDFTRELTELKSSLNEVEIQDKCCIMSLINHINQWVVKMWGSMELFRIIVITDGRIFWQPKEPPSPGTLFAFPAMLQFLCLESSANLSVSGSSQILQNILDCNNNDGSVSALFKSHLSQNEIISTATVSVSEFLDENYNTFAVNLTCGSLSNKVMVFPSPKLPNNQFEINATFQIVGFLNVADVGNPPVLSRHLLLPLDGELVEKVDDNNSSGHHLSFAVVLHGSLKKENKVALVKLSDDWYGIIYSWANSKVRSNLALSLLPRGNDSVPWMGDIRQLGPADLLHRTGQFNSDDLPAFPVQTKKTSKRSYAQPTVAWIRATGLQTDVQKILRSSKKLPEKSQVFYKDLNRLRRAALSFGFHELLEGISLLLERECTLLPGTAHPEAPLQLSHAARELKASINLGYDHTLEPLKTDFKFSR